MAKTARLEGRDGQVWTRYITGHTQEAIGAEFGISRERVSDILTEVRRSIPAVVKEHAVQRELDALDRYRAELDAIMSAKAPPMFNKAGTALLRDENGDVIRDVDSKLRSIQIVQGFIDRTIKLLGLDAPTRQQQEIVISELEKRASEDLGAEALGELGIGD